MDFRTKFTKWYYKKGYRLDYERVDYADNVGQVVYTCPWWVKPLTAYFFSPSAYVQEALADIRMRLDEEIDEMHKETTCETE